METQFQNKWAMLIGIDHYEYTQSLRYATNDVLALESALADYLVFPQENIFTFTDRSVMKTNRSRILNELKTIGEKGRVKADDLFIFFYSGHGIQYEDRQYILPMDASPQNVAQTGIAIEDVINKLKNTGCRNLVLFLDLCRDVSLLGEKAIPLIDEDTELAFSSAGIVTFFSCDPQERSYEIEALKHGSFTYSILEAIKDDECQTVSDLDLYLRHHVPLTNKKHNKPPQIPYTIIEPAVKGALPIFQNIVEVPKKDPLESVAASDIAFIGDAPKSEEDFLNRAELAFVLAARLNLVWNETNALGKTNAEENDADASEDPIERTGSTVKFRHRKTSSTDAGFVVHIDAPWGGGKTTFANYLLRILNPHHDGTMPDWLARLPLDDPRFWPITFRRPWHVVTFNAWQHQHVDPPWWCFYQAIRKGCFHAVRTEIVANQVALGGTEERRSARIPIWVHSFSNACRRLIKWLNLWLLEVSWRLFNPKVVALFVTFGLTWLAALSLSSVGVFNPDALKNALGGNLDDLPVAVATAVIVLFGGATAIWSVFAVVTESLLPGTPDAAKNYSLGSGDPLDRFRVHFDRLMRRLKQPVIVVVDDIDRCTPNFVVELLRGMQTILRSPRVIFVLLGDRDWIENSFANVHKTMKGINVGPEHTFGARFVEKAIQLSLVLPDVSTDARTEYIQTLLGVDAGAASKPTDALPEEERKDIEQKIETILGTPDPLIRDTIANSLRESIKSNTALNDGVRQTVVKQIDRQLALRSAADEKVQQATQHRLVPIASVLPANPRQIKRIINGISLFERIGRIMQEVQPGSDHWRKLALWVVIMTEWPQTWATLSTYPALVDLLHGAERAEEDDLPSREHVDAWLDAIRANRAVIDLIDFKGVDEQWPPTRIDTMAVECFRAFMPATSGQLLPTLESQSQSSAEPTPRGSSVD